MMTSYVRRERGEDVIRIVVDTIGECYTKMDNLPEEVLELILSKVSPYKDAENCSLVCTRWATVMKRSLARRESNFLSGLTSGILSCTKVSPSESVPKRYSQSCAYYNKGLYIFGGSASGSTTLNDLWRLDLSSRKWSRTFSTGSYPRPKACASMVLYRDQLILFGGWTNLQLGIPLFSSWKLLNECHYYEVSLNKWILIEPADKKPPLSAGHSATVHGDYMVVFGGLQNSRSVPQYSGSNDIWTFHVPSKAWEPVSIPEDQRPTPRYGQSQIKVDERHLLIIGGCGGPNDFYNDVWLLIMDNLGPWKWLQCEVRNLEFGAGHLWCNPACKMGDYVIALCKRTVDHASSTDHSDIDDIKEDISQSRMRWNVIPSLKRGINRGRPPVKRSNRPLLPRDNFSSSSSQSEEKFDRLLKNSLNHNADNSTLSVPIIKPDPLGARLQAFATTSQGKPSSNISTNKKSYETRQRQLEALKKMEDRLKLKSRDENHRRSKYKSCCQNLALHVLDIHRAVEDRVVTWLKLKTHHSFSYPEETILYSLVACRSELVMFGGVHEDPSSLDVALTSDSTKESISNTTYFFNPFDEVI